MENSDRTTVPPAKLLLVDDDPVFLTAMARMLSADYTVSTEPLANNVMNRLAVDGPFDVILCDLTMPSLSGAKLAELVSTVAPQYRSRMIFFTGELVTPEVMGFWSRPDVPRLWKYLSPALMRARLAEHVGRMRQAATGTPERPGS